MTSQHSRSSILHRALDYWNQHPISWNLTEIQLIHDQIETFLQEEYDTLPSAERLGKGAVFVCRCVAPSLARQYEQSHPHLTQLNIKTIVFLQKFFELHEISPRPFGKYIIIFFTAEFIQRSATIFNQLEPLILSWASDTNWEIRECAVEPIIQCIRYYPDATLLKLHNWVNDPNEYIRRLVAESLRPRSGIKWLRDFHHNGDVLRILSSLRYDPSEYVRKSVGNNLKDLTKYMPETIFKLADQWLKDSKITVIPTLASQTKKELTDRYFYMIWILKQAFRWLQAREPSFHPQLKSILGDNYVLYFDEKTNWSAHPN